jgi:hypothetical protein
MNTPLLDKYLDYTDVTFGINIIIHDGEYNAEFYIIDVCKQKFVIEESFGKTIGIAIGELERTLRISRHNRIEDYRKDIREGKIII